VGADHDGARTDHARGPWSDTHGPGDATEPAAATSRGVRVTWISLAILAVTAAAQLAIVTLTGSVALLADTLHNATDALTAVPLLIAFRLGRRAPTRRYPYGYHRAEDLAGVAIVMMILLSAGLAGLEAVRRLMHPVEIDHVELVLAAGLVGFAGNEAVAMYRTRVGRQIGSAALVADGLHARTDGITSLGVVLSSIAVMAGFERGDAIIGLAIVGAIMVTLVQAARSVLHRILDGTDEATIALIEAVASAVPRVEHVTDARARWTGHRLLAQLGVSVEPTMSVADGHAVADRVREQLLHEVPRLSEAVVHVDPHEHPSHGRPAGGVEDTDSGGGTTDPP
jgi:cation diffusion facilitator family transporter